MALPFDATALRESMRAHVIRRSWDPAQRVWQVVPTGASAGKLHRWAVANGFTMTPAATALCEAYARLGDLSRAEESGYPVPGFVGELHPFQPVVAEYLHLARRAIVADDMGTGKTLEALATLEAEGAYPALIVVPLGVLWKWHRHIARHLPHRSVELVRERAPGLDADITLLTYEELGRCHRALTRHGWASLVCDEAHRLRRRTSLRSRRVRRIASRIELIQLLTGSPVANRPADLIELLRILRVLDQDLGGWEAYTKRYCRRRKNRAGFNDISRSANLAELNRELRATCYIHRSKEQVARHLAPKHREVVPLAIANRTAYDRARADIIAWCVGRRVQSPEMAAELETLPRLARAVRQAMAAADAARIARTAEELVKRTRLRELAVEGKMPQAIAWLRDMLEIGDEDDAAGGGANDPQDPAGLGRKLVVFADSRSAQRTVLDAFPGAAHMLGDDPPEVRQANQERFQADPTCRLIVCAMRVAGEGIDLYAASDVVFLDLSWLPLDHDQAEDRAHRLGQAGAVTAWYLIAADTVEEEQADLLDLKADVAAVAASGGALAMPERLSDLLREASSGAAGPRGSTLAALFGAARPAPPRRAA